MRLRLLFALATTVALATAGCATGASSSPGSSVAGETANPLPTETMTAEPSGSAGLSAEPSGSQVTGDVVTITATEYQFSGLPANPTVGTELQLKNEGQEAHEMVVVRKNPGTAQSFEELLQMDESEVTNLVTILGAPAADPGETASETVTLDQPGDYALICFFPVGMTEIPSAGPGASFPLGEPHFVRGMFEQFTVTQ